MKLLYPETLETKYFVVQAVFTSYNTEDPHFVTYCNGLDELRAFCTLSKLILPNNTGELVIKDRMGFNQYLVLRIPETYKRSPHYTPSYWDFKRAQKIEGTDDYSYLYPELNAKIVGEDLLTIYRLCTSKTTEQWPNVFEDIEETGFGQFYDVIWKEDGLSEKRKYQRLYFTNWNDEQLKAGGFVKVDPKDYIQEDAAILLNYNWAQDSEHIVLTENDMYLSLVRCTKKYPNWKAVPGRKELFCFNFVDAVITEDVRQLSDKELVKRYLKTV